jgi:hypothetical protein
MKSGGSEDFDDVAANYAGEHDDWTRWKASTFFGGEMD